MSDDAGAQQGLTMAPSGVETTVGGVRITATLGTYPVLEVASAPQPLVTIGGVVLFLGALAWSFAGAAGSTRVASDAPESAEGAPVPNARVTSA